MNTIIDSPEFWIQQWNTSLESNPLRANRFRSVEMWDHRAETYKRNEKENSASRENEKSLIGRLVNKKILVPGVRILDIGCGPGNFTIPFAARGAYVLALDISKKMVQRLERETPADLKSNIKTRVANWRDLDLKKENLYKQFDLVFAHMTPAVNTPLQFLKMNDASKAWCLNATWTGQRTSNPFDGLTQIVYGKTEVNGSRYFIFALNLLINLGLYPETDFSTTSWIKEEALDDVVEYYTQYFSENPRFDSQEIRQKVTTFLKKKSVNGIVHKKNSGTIGRMLWHV